MERDLYIYIVSMAYKGIEQPNPTKTTKWRFPKMRVPRNHPFEIVIFHYKSFSLRASSILGKPQIMVEEKLQRFLWLSTWQARTSDHDMPVFMKDWRILRSGYLDISGLHTWHGHRHSYTLLARHTSFFCEYPIQPHKNCHV